MSARASHGDQQALLSTYPRQRPPLPAKIAALFEREYAENLHARGLAQALSKSLERWMHRKVARPSDRGRVLELGAGTLNHVQYEISADRYDIVEPRPHLYRDSPMLARIGSQYGDTDSIPAGESYDRIVSVACLEHLTDLPFVVARCGLMLGARGLFQAGIPMEGGFLWGLGWRISTGLSFRLRHGLDYGEIMRHEHVSDASEIVSVVQHLFSRVTLKMFPLPVRHLSLYCYLEAQTPLLDRCSAILSQAATGRTGGVSQ